MSIKGWDSKIVMDYRINEDGSTRLACFIVIRMFVRLNLINHFVGFIPCQFACDSALRNPVFRWESCKGTMWESVKKNSEVCNSIGPLTRSCDWQVAKAGIRVKHAGELKSHASCCTTRQQSQAGHSINSWLGLVTHSSRNTKSPVYSV